MDDLTRLRRAAEDQRDQAIAERDELRAILAPLLDDAKRFAFESTDGTENFSCLFCGGPECSEGRDSPDHILHDPTCPVLRRDTLLGRPGG